MNNPFKSIDDRLSIIESLLLDLKRNSGNTAAQQAPKVLTFEEGCKYLGIGKAYGYKLTSSRKIPYSKRGKRVYFEKGELDKWRLANKIKDIYTIQREAEQLMNKKKG